MPALLALAAIAAVVGNLGTIVIGTQETAHGVKVATVWTVHRFHHKKKKPPQLPDAISYNADTDHPQTRG